MRDTSIDSAGYGIVPLEGTRPVPPRHLQRDLVPPRRVQAVLRWATGTETITTCAVAWFKDSILVELSDPRCRFRAVWLALEDVTPLDDPSE